MFIVISKLGIPYQTINAQTTEENICIISMEIIDQFQTIRIYKYKYISKYKMDQNEQNANAHQQKPNQQEIAEHEQQKQQQFNNNQWVVWNTACSSQPCRSVKLIICIYVVRQWNWKVDKMGEICSQMLEWKASALWISQNKQPNILMQLRDVRLNNLIRIDVMGNNIQTIEMLYSVNMPILKQIYLQNNNIHQIKNLRRCMFPQLYFIGLGTNKIQDAYVLTQMPMYELTWLGLEHEDCQIFPQSIAWTAKICAQKINTLQLHNTKRIKQDRLDKVLLRKFISLQEIQRL